MPPALTSLPAAAQGTFTSGSATVSGALTSDSGPANSLAESAAATEHSSSISPATADDPRTADTNQLKTWWHANGEKNATGQVAGGNVRQSPFYSVQVATAPDHWNRYDSFTYLSIPRGGKGKPGYENGDDGYRNDGAEFASEANLTMSWSSFQYAADTWVDVALTTGETISDVADVVIRPTSLNLEKILVNDTTVRIHVPYAQSGYRFSVEFAPQLYDVSGASLWLSEAERTAPGVGVNYEPRNSMLIFAEPLITATSNPSEFARVVPQPSAGSIHYVPTGDVTQLNSVAADVLYFGPGTYTMGARYHAVLNPQVKWVYLAPGAYVKGAFEFTGSAGVYKVTGMGVLSGEQYVYEADRYNNYDRRDPAVRSNCHSECVKMLQFGSTHGYQQYLDLHGVTVTDPPYHSFVVSGDESTFEMRVEHYKQVGSWVWQTDGLELYDGSTMRDSFFNVNDDALKIYHSDVTIDNTVVWKFTNGPVVQWGWGPKNIANVHVTNTHVIHNRMHPWDAKRNSCVLNSATSWEDTEATNTANLGQNINGLYFENMTVETPVNCVIRLWPQANTKNIRVKNLIIKAWDRPLFQNDTENRNQYNLFERTTNDEGQPVALGSGSEGLLLENFAVAGQFVTRVADNWQSDRLGRLLFGGDLWGNWDAYQTADAPSPSIAVNDRPDPCVVGGSAAVGKPCPASDPANGGSGGDGDDGGDGGSGSLEWEPGHLSADVLGGGAVQFGATLRANADDWPEGLSDWVFEWLADGQKINGADGFMMTLGADLIDKTIATRVTASKNGVTHTRTSAAVGPVAPKAWQAGTVRIEVQGDSVPRVGATLIAHGDDWPGDMDGWAFRWFANGVQVAGETGYALVLTPQLIGKRVSARITGTMGAPEYGGVSHTRASEPTSEVLPVEFVPGTVTLGGAAAVGQTLTAHITGWQPGVELAYQWFADEDEVPGATAASVVVEAANAGKRLRARLIADPAGGQYGNQAPLTVWSPWSDIIAAPEWEPGSVRIDGIPRVGERLTAGLEDWPEHVDIDLQWLIDGELAEDLDGGVSTVGESGDEILLTADHIGRTIQVRAVGESRFPDAYGHASATVTSAPTAPIAGLELEPGTVAVHGDLIAGGEVTAGVAQWPDHADLAFEWFAGDLLLSGQVSPQLRLGAGLIGKHIQARVTATSTDPRYAGATSVTSARTRKVVRGLAPRVKVRVKGRPRVGVRARAVMRVRKSARPVRVSYRWYVGGKRIKGATKSRLKVRQRWAGKKIRVRVIVKKTGHKAARVTSRAKVIRN